MRTRSEFEKAAHPGRQGGDQNLSAEAMSGLYPGFLLAPARKVLVVESGPVEGKPHLEKWTECLDPCSCRRGQLRQSNNVAAADRKLR